MSALPIPRPSRRRLVAMAATAALVLIAACSGDDSSGNVVADATKDTGLPTQSAPTTLASVADQPCVEAKDLPEGSPEVTMPVGEVPTELVQTDITTGDGAEAELGKSITVDYVGVACSSGEVFDSSYESGEPAQFTLEEGGLIQGWIEGIPGMKVGGQRQLVIPADLAYGEAGNQGIAPDEALVFVIELKDVTDAPAEGETSVPAEGEPPTSAPAEGDATTTAPVDDATTTSAAG